MSYQTAETIFSVPAMTFAVTIDPTAVGSLSVVSTDATTATIRGDGTGNPQILNLPGFALLNMNLTSFSEVDVTTDSTLEFLSITNSNLLTTLNASGLTSLQTVGVDHASALASVNLTGLSGLTSAVFDTCPALTSINLTDCTSLSEFYTRPSGLTAVDLSVCSVLFACGFNNSTSLTSVTLPSTSTLQFCTLFHCTALPDLDITGCTGLLALNCQNCAIASDASINAILAQLLLCPSGGSVDLSGGSNAAPTGQGITDAATLVGAGWSVTTN